MHDCSRRRLLAVVGGTLSGVAGCGAPQSGDGGDGGAPETTGTPTSSTAATASATPDLDLREANVVDVAVSEAGDGYRFDVTLYHDDDGEDGYADWWQVETIDGERLGRRKLLHAHSTAPFTRSAEITVPDGTACVVVRGHDQTHGYGGQAMLVAVDSGAARAVAQGPERRSMTDGDCP